MRRLGRIAAEGLMERPRAASRGVRGAATIADRDRAILELWDLDWSIDAIADELRVAPHLIEQAVALFGGSAA